MLEGASRASVLVQVALAGAPPHRAPSAAVPLTSCNLAELLRRLAAPDSLGVQVTVEDLHKGRARLLVAGGGVPGSELRLLKDADLEEAVAQALAQSLSPTPRASLSAASAPSPSAKAATVLRLRLEVDAGKTSDARGGVSLPSSMQCARYTHYGSPQSVLEVLEEYSVPKLSKPDEVLIRVHACSPNPVDVKIMRGQMQSIRKLLPFIPGFDVSGVVMQTGLECTRIKKGDAVFGLADFRRCGTFAEYVVLQEKEVSLKPSNLSHEEAAVIPLVGTLAFKALFLSAEIEPRNKVLVLGGGGGAGLFAVQLLRAVGARVTVTCAPGEGELCRQCGAEVALDGTEGVPWWTVLEDAEFDAVYDTVGGEGSYQHSQAVLKPRGSFVTIHGDNREGLVAEKDGSGRGQHGSVTLTSLAGSAATFLGRKFMSLFGDAKYDVVLALPDYEVLDALREFVERARLRPFISRRYTCLRDAVDAFCFVDQRSGPGKVSVSVVLEAPRVEQAEEKERGVFVIGSPVHVGQQGGLEEGVDTESMGSSGIGDSEGERRAALLHSS